jgi:hypothetical protein
MSPLVDTIGNKAAGQLVRSADWNTLVVALDALTAQVASEFTAVRSEVAAADDELRGLIESLDARVTQLETQLTTLQVEVEPLLSQTYRVTLTTTKANYALGELAELTAQVTTLQGNPVTDRPWVDFVATWGQLRPVSGFESRGGVGDRTISVRTNDQGIARVLVRAEHAEGFAEEDEDEVAVALTTRLQANNLSVAEQILQANTPLEAKEKGAFGVLSTEYNRSDALIVRNYVDAYYLRNPTMSVGKITPDFIERFRSRWRDYRATVMAFAKADSDPLTPDHSRSVNSIQITFRDWIGPWIFIDYFDKPTLDVQVPNIRDQLAPNIRDNLKLSIDLVKARVIDLVRDKGVLGKLQQYEVINRAIGQIGGAQPFLPQLTDSVQKAIGLQQTLENFQAAPVGLIGASDKDVAFDVFTDAATRADANMAGVTGEIDSLKGQVGQFAGQFAQFDARFNTLQGTINNLGVDQLKADVAGFRSDVFGLGATSLLNQVNVLKQSVVEIDTRTKIIQDQGRDIGQKVQVLDERMQEFSGVDRQVVETLQGRVLQLDGELGGLQAKIRNIPGLDR